MRAPVPAARGLLLAAAILLAAGPAHSVQFIRSDAPTGGSFSTGVGVGDFDGDGFPDVVSSNFQSGDLTVFFNVGGTLVPQSLLTAGGPFGPWWATAGDLNGDGLDDILASQLGTDETLVYLNQGGGVFGTPAIYPVDDSPEFVHVADLNGDGFLDFVSTNSTNRLDVYFGDGSGTFDPSGADVIVPLTYFDGHTARTADIDNDGDLDIAVSHSSTFSPDCEGGRVPVSIALNDGTGQFPSVMEYGTEMGYHGILGDWNNDGWVDYASADSCNNEVRVLLNDGTGQLVGPTGIFFAGQTSHNDLHTADLNCDGNLDLLVAESGSIKPLLHVLLGDGTGSFSEDPDGPFPSNGPPSSVRTADMDGDGVLDVVTANIASDTASIWLSQVVDDDPPVVTCETAVSCLWPPNHEMVDVGLSFLAEDGCQGLLEDGSVLEVTSDEPTNSQLGAGGKGNDRDPTPHAPDAMMVDGRLLLRAERSGLEDGRVYRITVAATDAAGNTGTAVCEVRVPHDQDPKTPGQVPGNDPDGPCPAVDSGGTFDAFEVN